MRRRVVVDAIMSKSSIDAIEMIYSRLYIYIYTYRDKLSEKRHVFFSLAYVFLVFLLLYYYTLYAWVPGSYFLYGVIIDYLFYFY